MFATKSAKRRVNRSRRTARTRWTVSHWEVVEVTEKNTWLFGFSVDTTVER